MPVSRRVWLGRLPPFPVVGCGWYSFNAASGGTAVSHPPQTSHRPGTHPDDHTAPQPHLERGHPGNGAPGKGGGLVGWALSQPLLQFFGPLLTGLLYLALLTWGLSLVTHRGWVELQRGLRTVSLRLRQFAVRVAPTLPAINPAPPRSAAPTPAPLPGVAPLTHPQDELVIMDDTAAMPQTGSARRDKQLPPLTLLEEGGAVALTPAEIEDKKQKIEQTLRDFGLPATVIQIRRGPAVTQFGVQPGYVEKPGPDGTIKPHKVRVGRSRRCSGTWRWRWPCSGCACRRPCPARGWWGSRCRMMKRPLFACVPSSNHKPLPRPGRRSLWPWGRTFPARRSPLT